ncbi:hypothetical protein F5141DRAFT_1274744 [Pisolithus sp. B1]|nr:hypothetical protein F5141DRAFT_1274744 [Pisolithus sp. B1]
MPGDALVAPVFPQDPVPVFLPILTLVGKSDLYDYEPRESFSNEGTPLASIKEWKASSDSVIYFDHVRSPLSIVFLDFPRHPSIGTYCSQRRQAWASIWYHVSLHWLGNDTCFLPLAIRVTSSVAMRVVLTELIFSFTFKPSIYIIRGYHPQSEKPFTFKPRARIRKLTSLGSISTYTTLLPFVPVPVATHRLLLAEADALVWSSSEVNSGALGSPKFDFEFVQTAIRK